jgi:predicted alpha/beta superfamily hydrolase
MRAMLGALALLLSPSPMRAQVGGAGADSTVALSIGETFTMRSDVLDERRRINVWVPPIYADSDAVRLPVLYMPDGGIAEDFLHVAGLVQVSVGNGTMRPFILVGIENTERRRDLTRPTSNAEDRTIAPRVGGSAAFRRFIRTELIPAIASRFRTTDERAIIGESLAGLFIVETYFVEPDLFDSYIAFDPSLWWNDESLVKSAAGRARPAGSRRLWLASSSEKDLSRLTRELFDALRAKAAAVDYRSMPAETHATIYHPAALDALRALFAPHGPSAPRLPLPDPRDP